MLLMVLGFEKMLFTKKVVVLYFTVIKLTKRFYQMEIIKIIRTRNHGTNALAVLANDGSLIWFYTNSEIEELWPLFNTLDVDIDAQPEDGGALVNYTVNILKRYRMVSMEDISKVCMMNKKELRKELSKQLEEDCLHGSSWE